MKTADAFWQVLEIDNLHQQNGISRDWHDNLTNGPAFAGELTDFLQGDIGHRRETIRQYVTAYWIARDYWAEDESEVNEDDYSHWTGSLEYVEATTAKQKAKKDAEVLTVIDAFTHAAIHAEWFKDEDDGDDFDRNKQAVNLMVAYSHLELGNTDGPFAPFYDKIERDAVDDWPDFLERLRTYERKTPEQIAKWVNTLQEIRWEEGEVGSDDGKKRAYYGEPAKDFLQYLHELDALPSVRAVGLVLLLHRNTKTGKTYPSQGRISQLTGFSERTVYAAMKWLRDKRIVKRVQHHQHSGEWSESARYIFTDKTAKRIGLKT